MSAPPVANSYYADFGRLEALKKTARQDQPAAIREAARQFESLFTNMLLKSMREANLGEGMGDSEQTQFYQDMFDQQLAVQMSQGKGLGLAERLVQQLQRAGLSPPAALSPAGAQAPALAPGTPGSTVTDKPASNHSRAHFIQGIWPYAAQAAKRIGVAIESVIAHAALETGWGRHLPVSASGDSNNLFGVKAGSSWRGSSAASVTEEFTGRETVTIRAPFRAYASVAAGISDYADLLTGSPRFAAALNRGDDATAFALGLQRGGYATDPAYVHKLVTTVAAVRELTAPAQFKNSAALPTTLAAGTV